MKKELIDVGLTAPVRKVALSDDQTEIYIPVKEYSDLRLNDGMNDEEIFNLFANA